MAFDKNTIIILDNGHGQDTPGKRSPEWNDGSQLFEYASCRDLVQRIASKLGKAGIRYKIIVPEMEDISLSERCRRANNIYSSNSKNAILISIHHNAACSPNTGKGWEAYTTPGTTKSDEVATALYKQAEKYFPDRKIRKDCSDGDPDKESNLYILKHTSCPAVLTENFFMDTEDECKKILMNESGRDKIAQMHVDAIKNVLGL